MMRTTRSACSVRSRLVASLSMNKHQQDDVRYLQRSVSTTTNPRRTKIEDSSSATPTSTTTNKMTSSPAKPIIPAPTWSIHSLQLAESHPPITTEELLVLARRAVLDPSQLDATKLCHETANMLHMIRAVSFVVPNSNQNNTVTPLSTADLYDVPRGVTAAPVRTDKEPSRDEQEMKHVWKSLLQPKTKRVGAHSYFGIVTARTNKNE